MEPVGVVSEASWNSFNATMSVDESEIMALLLGPYPFATNDHELGPSVGIPAMLWLDPDSDSYHFSDNSDPSSNFWSQLYSSTSTDSFFPPASEYETYCRSDLSVMPAISASCAPMDVWVEGEQITNPSVQILPTHQFVDPVFLNEEVSSDDPIALPDRKSLPESKIHTGEEDEPFTHGEIPTGGRKRKARASAKVERSTKIPRSKKTRRDRDESESNAAVNGQSSSSCSSEDDSIAPHEGGGMRSSSKGSAALDQKGSRRAGRGSATDPQSLYARKRREKISERLRILQNLVPNGTKVDISTMLEEAVQYVKFLEVQIKLLSSDELWMYAPIAYNGMGIGIDLMVSPPRQ